ncbi:hypothetical protein [Cellulosilyticum sp. I15G10I2]|uniref:hypothetical protein n=1 Tax=Cellulosilyticum sp. I15G10I2 TaxID=1892843 RepID=UPI00085BF87B|nr:hypothetical protein [Cellulosilyticum sp. I15G10I2]
MKKIVCYMPAIIFIIFYGLIIISTGLSISPFVYAWIALFLISGVLLSKGEFRSGLLGMLPGIHLMYMSTKDTGQMLPIELPLGIIVVTFYLLCSGFIFYKKKKSKK